MTSTVWKNNFGTFLYNFKSGTLASGKTRVVARKTGKTTTVWFLAAKILAQMGQVYNQHGLEEHILHLAFATSTDARVPLAKLGWFPSQANLPLMVAGNEVEKHSTEQTTDLLCTADSA